MKTVSIIFVASGSFFLAKRSFESIGFSLKEKLKEIIIPDEPIEYIKVVDDVQVELFVIDRTNNSQTAEYFADIATNITCKDLPLAVLYNSAFKMATGDYICIIPTGAYLQKDWIIELLYYYANIDKSGVIGIVSDFNDCDFLPLLSTDGENQINVLVSKNNLIDGLSFFDRQHLYLIGAFDESVNLTDNEVNQFALRCIAMGYYNYYVPTDTCILFVGAKNEQSELNMKNTLAEMKKRKNYYLPL